MTIGIVCCTDIPHNRADVIIEPDTENERVITIKGLYAIGDEVEISEKKMNEPVMSKYSNQLAWWL